MDLPLSETLMVSVLPEIEPVTEDGLGGFVPSSSSWKRVLISPWRQVQSSFVETLAPETLVNGSGSFGMLDVVGFVVRLEHVVEPPPLGDDTGVVDELVLLVGGGSVKTGLEELVLVLVELDAPPCVPGRH